MVARWLVVLAIAPACSLVFPLPDEPGDDSGAGDAGPDAPGGPTDRDGDGVANAADNCPDRGNPDQHDEDKDAVGDVCDRCPHLKGDQADRDGDGVGDECDPHPDTFGDTLVLFDGFGQPAPSAQWMRIAGEWTTGADTLRADPDGAPEPSRIALATPTIGTVTVSAAFAVVAPTTPAGAGGILVDVTALDGRMCGLVDDTAVPRQGLYNTAGGLFVISSKPIGASGTTDFYRITAATDGRRCEAGANPVLVGDTGGPLPVHTGKVGFYVSNARVVIDYVLVIRSF